jgi:antitoxin (DNA-binding transcriptional repressor) of toxin-antitoxin stability system
MTRLLPYAIVVTMVAGLGSAALHYRGQAQTARAELVAAVERGRNAALAEHARQSNMIADMAVIDRGLLLADLAAIADRGRERVTVFRDRWREIEPPPCGPGQGFVDAVNEALR